MIEDLNITNNSLSDIVNWLKNGYIVCLYSYNKKIFFYFKETIDEIVDEKIIYINLNLDHTLLNDDEWPSYIMIEGFKQYISIDKLPTNPKNIYKLKLKLCF